MRLVQGSVRRQLADHSAPFAELMQTPDPDVVARVSQAMFSMTKMVVADLETAAAG